MALCITTLVGCRRSAKARTTSASRSRASTYHATLVATKTRCRRCGAQRPPCRPLTGALHATSAYDSPRVARSHCAPRPLRSPRLRPSSRRTGRRCTLPSPPRMCAMRCQRRYQRADSATPMPKPSATIASSALPPSRRCSGPRRHLLRRARRRMLTTSWGCSCIRSRRSRGVRGRLLSRI